MLRGVRSNTKGSVRKFARKVRDGAARLRPLSDRRRFGRIKGDNLGCNLGRVIDLSAGGMRLRSPRRLSSRLTVEIWSQTRRVTVNAKVAWIKRLGLRKYDVGLEFTDVTPEVADKLTQFAVYLTTR